MKFIFSLIILLSANPLLAQEAVVDIGLHPAGSFQVKSTEVRGQATRKGDAVSAKNINVGLKNLQTGVGLRDTHTKKHLDVEHFPDATLVSADGAGGKGHGIIRIMGIEKPVVGSYEIKGSKLIAHFPIQLSDFKIEGIKYMGVGVDNNATITVTVPVTN